MGSLIPTAAESPRFGEITTGAVEDRETHPHGTDSVSRTGESPGSALGARVGTTPLGSGANTSTVSYSRSQRSDCAGCPAGTFSSRSEEHTAALQSRFDIGC